MEDDDFNNEGENSDNSNRVESDIDEPVDMQQIENRIVQDGIVIENEDFVSDNEVNPDLGE